jgi:hypothetical protein
MRLILFYHRGKGEKCQVLLQQHKFFRAEIVFLQKIIDAGGMFCIVGFLCSFSERLRTCVQFTEELSNNTHMNNLQKSDRREFPRFQIQIPLSLSISGEPREETCDATAMNVSMNGVCCTIDRYLPVFDKVLLTFVLPEDVGEPYHLVSQCEGIVVRVDPEEEQPDCKEYQVAVYFNSLSQAERDLLQSLIVSYAEG